MDSQYPRFHSRHLIQSVPLRSEESLWHLHVTYGAPLWYLFLHADSPGRYHEMVKSEINMLSSRDLTRLLQSPDDVTNNLYYVISIGPSPTARSTAERKIASPYILEACRKRMLKDQWRH